MSPVIFGQFLEHFHRRVHGRVFEPSDGGALRPLTTDSALDAGPRWCPDGEEMAFDSTRGGHRQVRVMPAAGGPRRGS